MAVSDRIDKMLAIEVALEMVNDLSKSSATRADIQATRDYIYSIEDVVPIGIITELYELVSHFEIYQHKFNNKFH